MSAVADLIKSYLVPGSITFLILGFVVGVALLYGRDRTRKWGRRWLTVLALAYWALSTPLIADWIVGGLTRRYQPLSGREAARGAQTIVLLSVGSTAYVVDGQQVPELGKDTAYNVLEAARVYRMLGNPLIITSGGASPSAPRAPDSEMMREALVKLGVPADRVLVESRSANTREQATFTADLLRQRGIKTFVLVTAPEHMNRAVPTFEALGFTVVPAVSAFKEPVRGSWWEQVRLSRGALLQSDWAVYEYLARVYYWLRGWT